MGDSFSARPEISQFSKHCDIIIYLISLLHEIRAIQMFRFRESFQESQDIGPPECLNLILSFDLFSSVQQFKDDLEPILKY